MFIEPTITWVPSGFSGYIWLDTKIVLKKKKKKEVPRPLRNKFVQSHCHMSNQFVIVIVIVNRHLKNATPNKCSSWRCPQQLSKY